MLLIVYGSLYPWHFEPRALGANPFWILLHSWEGPLNRYMVGDILINIALYVPLGMSAYSVFRRFRQTLLAWIGPVILGAALSCAIEMIQLFEPTRHCSALDVMCNTIGAALGIFGGWIFEELSAIHPRRAMTLVDRAALALLFCWAAYLFFPMFPVLGRTMTRQKVDLFLHNGFSPVAMVSTAACWFVAGCLLVAAGIRHARIWLAFALLAIPAQILIVFRQPELVEVMGAAIGFTLFLLLSKRIPPALTAICFLLLLILRGLVPFHFEPNPVAFSWLPFGGFLAMDWRPGMVVLLEKLFYYGTAIWLLRTAGMRLLWAAPTVAIVLAIIEAAQVWLPGRTAEITDPLLAILMGAILAACQPKAYAISASRVQVLT